MLRLTMRVVAGETVRLCHLQVARDAQSSCEMYELIRLSYISTHVHTSSEPPLRRFDILGRTRTEQVCCSIGLYKKTTADWLIGDAALHQRCTDQHTARATFLPGPSIGNIVRTE